MERIDDLMLRGLRIIQDDDLFGYGIDAVLLADYVRAGKRERVLDIGTGTGILPLLLHGRGKGACIDGLEIQMPAVNLARRSIAMNGLTEHIRIIHGDIRTHRDERPYDVLVTNPPYMRVGSGRTVNEPCIAKARTEICMTVDDVFRAAGHLLKEHGRIYMIHRPDRLGDIFYAARSHRMEAKHMRMIKPYPDKAPTMVLMTFVKGGRPFLTVAPDLIVYEAAGIYTDEVRRIYNM
ncbi:MAG: tRNA1(Val) (adenine(37)-N6)-methyltransferase [Eubacteriales bacterium]|nr:tRNA1(Val) (adenine(37)-N6)-methyltransferase [Eubacteriales bacterium]